MKKLFIMAALCLSFSNRIYAQELRIGDKVPDFNIGKIINYVKESLKFSDIKAKLIIIDYWHTSCSSCIAAMPKMDALQKQFGDKILILPATGQKEETIRPFWAKNKYLNSTSLPTIVGDTLKKYFPYGGVPYHVWILDGKVFAMPDSPHANAKEIADVLAGKEKKWVLSWPSLERKVDNESSLVEANLSDTYSKHTYYNVITGNDPLLSGTNDNFSDENRSFTRLLFRNREIIDLYKQAYWFSENIVPSSNIVNFPKRRILEVKDINRFVNPDEEYNLEWQRDHNISYEAILPGKLDKKQMGKYMLADLNRLLGLNGRIEKRKKECVIMTLQTGVKHVKDKVIEYDNESKRREILDKFGYPSPELTAFDKQKSEFFLYVYSTTASIADHLGSYENLPPAVDETGYKQPFNITMKFPANGKATFEELKVELNKHGFDLKKGIREIDMFVITENDWRQGAK